MALVAAAAGVVTSPGAAHAASCGTASGVTVVVDFHQLGGVQSACDANGAGEYAADQFTDVGHTLTYVQGQAFVCQVDAAPTTQCVRTPPATAYWSLWWSDGKSGTWTYASLGVGSLKVPAGGYVALSWQKGGAQAPPTGHPHLAHAARRRPRRRPIRPRRHPATTRRRPPPPARPDLLGDLVVAHVDRIRVADGVRILDGEGATRHHHASKSPSATPSATQSDLPSTTEAAAPTDRAAADSGSGSGLPGWLAPVLVGALFVAAGVVAVVRRKRAGER